LRPAVAAGLDLQQRSRQWLHTMQKVLTHALVVIDFMLTYLFIAEIFRQHFDRFGKVVEAQIMVDHTSGRSRGFG
jgi:RNA recognition motif-containing protein